MIKNIRRIWLWGGKKGLKVTYCTDSRPVQIISDNAKESDLSYVRVCMERMVRKLRQRNISI